ncbi:hypothetical protein, partial [Nocardioides guangzhouensis]|uniref:hypothetical protein n=1 Tax=Nocardioides guangzhouensis TaxID=2497878 RepID=UPI001C378738
MGDGSRVSDGEAVSVGSSDGSTDVLGPGDPVGWSSGSFWSSPPESRPPTFPIVVVPESDPPVIA